MASPLLALSPEDQKDQGVSDEERARVHEMVKELEEHARRAREAQPRMTFAYLCHLIAAPFRGERKVRHKLSTRRG